MDLTKYLAKPNKTIREHTDDLLEAENILKNLGYIDEKISDLLNIACEYHDYGKVNQNFQNRVKSRGKLKFDNEIEVAHNVLSLTLLEEKIFSSKEDYYKVAYAILNHHNHTNNQKEVEDKKELIKEFAKKFGGETIKRGKNNKIGRLKDNIEASILKGLLHKCDYSASGDYTIEYPNDFLLNSMENLGYKWNKLQEFCIENRDENIIVVANTGMGKTEAGLLWIGDHKGFFILPLKTAINAIYKRIKDDIVKEKLEVRLALTHSDTLSYYLKESVAEEEKAIEYSQKGKQLNMPLSITTLDQIFNFVYKYYGFELKLATLSYSKLVIDEIQAYSPDLLAYLISGLKSVTSVGGKFAILTATLPPFIKDLIEKEIGKIKYANFTEGEVDKKNGIDTNKRHHLKILNEKINSEYIYNHYLKNKKKSLIVCNTVKESQRIYLKLKELLGKDHEINLLHAKFIKEDRAEKEKKIIEFGKTTHIADGIWISTSLVEASLDIDFDYLFTELNDLNGLFQRLGRVNRKGKKYQMLDKPNAFVFTEIEKGLLINKNGTKGFIDKTIYELSKNGIKELDGIIEEKMKVEIIDRYLTSENLGGSTFMKNYINIKNYIESLYVNEKTIDEVNNMFRNITSFQVIPRVIYDNKKIRLIINKNMDILKEKFSYNQTFTKEENEKMKKSMKISKVKAQNEIEQYTVSVGQWDMVNKTGEKLDLGFKMIDIINCEYDNEIGYVRVKKEKEEVEEIDSFF